MMENYDENVLIIIDENMYEKSWENVFIKSEVKNGGYFENFTSDLFCREHVAGIWEDIWRCWRINEGFGRFFSEILSRAFRYFSGNEKTFQLYCFLNRLKSTPLDSASSFVFEKTSSRTGTVILEISWIFVWPFPFPRIFGKRKYKHVCFWSFLIQTTDFQS